MIHSEPMRNELSAYCSRIAQDPLLVQAAGGNVSWKTGTQMWIKASGTWLAEAEQKDIFVPVDQKPLSNALQQGDFSITPTALPGHTLRPSIETLLHALMPQRIVLHLHPVDVVSWLVRQDAHAELKARLGHALHWELVDYYKPGPDLARAVQDKVRNKPEINLVFLKNHGVLLGAPSLEQLDPLLQQVMRALHCPPQPVSETIPWTVPPQTIGAHRYGPCSDPSLHCLARDAALYAQLDARWAVCPDHLVFLGAQACLAESIEQVASLAFNAKPAPAFIFVQGQGVLQSDKVSAAQLAQLAFYRNVLLRIEPGTQLSVLTPDDIAGLLNWDAEKYRIALNQSLQRD